MNVYDEIIQWLEEHEGKMPRGQIRKKGKTFKVEEITKEEKYERNLYARFNCSPEKKTLDEYAGRPIEEIPKEYREKIETLRKYGLGITIYEEIIQWLEEHEGKMPRGQIRKEGKTLKVEEKTKEEKYERNLYVKFYSSPEKKILDEYAGRPIEEVPKEYREKIENLRRFGLGIKEKSIYEEIIQWLEEHKGKMPRGQIKKEGKVLKKKEMTEKEQYERSVAQRFNKSLEKKILEKYKGRPIKEVPEEYREKIENLRKYELRITPYEEIIKWLEEHNGKMPRGSISKNGRILKKIEMTEEEKYERNLAHRFYCSSEKEILDEYEGRPIEEVPEEYIEKISKLRESGQSGKQKDEKVKNIMKKTIAKQVKNNQDTRKKLYNLEYQINSKNINDSSEEIEM